jgi:hypothetical protein
VNARRYPPSWLSGLAVRRASFLELSRRGISAIEARRCIPTISPSPIAIRERQRCRSGLNICAPESCLCTGTSWWSWHGPTSVNDASLVLDRASSDISEGCALALSAQRLAPGTPCLWFPGRRPIKGLATQTTRTTGRDHYRAMT